VWQDQARTAIQETFMLKKIVTTAIASAFAVVLAAPVAMACPGHDSSVAKKDKAESTKTADKTKAKKSEAKPEKSDKTKVVTKKVVSKG
jgi:Ni/Co efflux regulator RcnB